MSNESQILHQVLSDPYRSKADKDAARARLDQLSGLVRERGLLDKNASGLEGLAAVVDRLRVRIEVLEYHLLPVTPGAAVEPAVTIPPPTPDVETVPQVNIPDDRGQKQGRPKNRYVVDGERGNWGIQDTETGLYVYPVQKKRKDADRICRQINAGNIPVTSAVGIRGEAEASVALDKDPDCGTQSIEAQQGTEAPQVEEDGGKSYQSYEEKPAPPVRPDRERSTSAVGRVPWYAK